MSHQQRLTVTSVHADAIDVSTGNQTQTTIGRTEVTACAGLTEVTIEWKSSPIPRVGDHLTLTIDEEEG